MRRTDKLMIAGIIALSLCIIIYSIISGNKHAAAEEGTRLYTHIIDTLNAEKKLVEERYLNDDEETVLCEDGYAIMRKEYNENMQETRTSYYNEYDMPVLVEKLGYASVESVYDENGKKIETRYYNAAGKALSLEDKGYAGVHNTYDEHGFIASEAYFDEKGEPFMLKAGYHRVDYTWNDAKQKLTERYYDTEGNLVVIAKGYAGIDHEYDEDGNDVYCAFYNAITKRHR